MTLEQDQRIAEVVGREQSRLRSFIRRRVPDPGDVEDILQDVFTELVEANRLLMPIDHVAAWLFQVTRNRIIDLFRRKKPESFGDIDVPHEDDEGLRLEDLLPSPDAGPDALYARQVLLDELELAVGEFRGSARGVRGPRDRGAQLQGTGGRDGSGRQHSALPQALRGVASARAAPRRL